MHDPRPKATLAVSLTSFPNHRIASAISGLVSEFCRGLVEDADVVDRFHMAAQELAENLVKYSSGSKVSMTAELLGTDERAVLQLEAKNRSTPDRLHAIEQLLRELTTTPDPIGLYDRLIRESAPSAEGSGLGLARIRAEGQLNVDYSIEGSELTISVHAAVHPQEGA